MSVLAGTGAAAGLHGLILPAPVPPERIAEWRTTCQGIDGDGLPGDAVVQRDQSDGTVRQAKGANLSRELERYEPFRKLQRESREEEVALCFVRAYRRVFRLESPWRSCNR